MTDINVSITRESGIVTGVGFGIALIVSSSLHTYKEYASLDELVSDFADTTAVYKMASALLGQSVQPEKFAVSGIDYTAGVDPVADLSTHLDTLVADGKDFYLVLQEQDDDASQVEVSTWANDNNKLHFIRADVLPSSFVGSLSDRTSVYYTTTADEYPECAVAGYGLANDPGALTWKNIVIKGITPEILTGAEESELETNRWNTIITYYNKIVTSNGFLIGSTFIDQTRTQDYVKVTMEEFIADLLITNNKIPYTDPGIAQFVSTVNKALLQAFDNGIIASDIGGNPLFTVDFKTIDEIPEQDIIDRILRTVSFEYQEAGAIEGASVSGKIVVKL